MLQEHEKLHEDMLPLAKAALKKWQYLKRYITKAYGEAYWEMNWNAAGWQYYDGNEAWEETKSLMNEGKKYIALHSAELLAGDNMPATFEDDFNAAGDAFKNKYSAFLAAEEAAWSGTDDKIAANNDIYEKIISVCEDGQAISDDETFSKLFSFERMSELVSPPGSSTAVIMVTSKETGAPLIAGVTVDGTDRSVETVDGKAEIGQLAAKKTTFTVIADGFEEEHVTMTLKNGVTSRMVVEMKPLVMELPAGSDTVEV